MNRNKKIILTSHCILNVNAKVDGLAQYKGIFSEIIRILDDNNLGILQLPCPEMVLYGANRNHHTKEQFDNLFYRKQCKKMLEPIAMQLKSYIDNNYEIIGIIGIDGSPSCGINKTCGFDNNQNSIIIDGSGVFMEELLLMLEEYNIKIPKIGINEMNVKDSIKDIEKFISSKVESFE